MVRTGRFQWRYTWPILGLDFNAIPIPHSPKKNLWESPTQYHGNSHTQPCWKPQIYVGLLILLSIDCMRIGFSFQLVHDYVECVFSFRESHCCIDSIGWLWLDQNWFAYSVFRIRLLRPWYSLTNLVGYTLLKLYLYLTLLSIWLDGYTISVMIATTIELEIESEPINLRLVLTHH